MRREHARGAGKGRQGEAPRPHPARAPSRPSRGHRRARGDAACASRASSLWLAPTGLSPSRHCGRLGSTPGKEDAAARVVCSGDRVSAHGSRCQRWPRAPRRAGGRARRLPRGPAKGRRRLEVAPAVLALSLSLSPPGARRVPRTRRCPTCRLLRTGAAQPPRSPAALPAAAGPGCQASPPGAEGSARRDEGPGVTPGDLSRPSGRRASGSWRSFPLGAGVLPSRVFRLLPFCGQLSRVGTHALVESPASASSLHPPLPPLSCSPSFVQPQSSSRGCERGMDVWPVSDRLN